MKFRNIFFITSLFLTASPSVAEMTDYEIKRIDENLAKCKANFTSEGKGVWYNKTLTVAGLEIRIDYMVEYKTPNTSVYNRQADPSFEYIAKELWVNVSGDSLSPSDTVYVMLIGYKETWYRADTRTPIEFKVEDGLEYAGENRFTVKLPEMPLKQQYFSGHNTTYVQSRAFPQYELAIWVNGEIEPYKVDGHNLRFSMPFYDRGSSQFELTY